MATLNPCSSSDSSSSTLPAAAEDATAEVLLQQQHQLKQESPFKALKLLDLRSSESRNDKIPLDASVLHGKLDNGLAYYVKKNSKPRERAALALVVAVGSFAEEEEERGVAHIVEHLAFSATANYSNHDLVKFLESIGAEFGACQNAYTSADETVYELFVPVDKEGLLVKSLGVLAEFASKIRASDEDLQKERGAVLEEWRERRNAMGRMQEAHWKLLMEGSKYAERLPIGLEKVIRSVPASVVRGFYKRWYRPHLMAVIAVGDFPDEQAVLRLIRDQFGSIAAADTTTTTTSGSSGSGGCSLVNGNLPEETGEEGTAAADTNAAEATSNAAAAEGDGTKSTKQGGDGAAATLDTSSTAAAAVRVPEEPFVAHRVPRFSCLAEREAGGSAVMVSCKLPVAKMESVGDYREFVRDDLFHMALNQRFFRVSRRQSPPPPFYSCSSADEPLVKSTRAFSVNAACKDKGTLEALEAVWTEIARVQEHGFSEREISRVRMQYLADVESAYVEKDQTYSDSLRDEYTQHFLRDEPAPGIEYEAKLAKTLVPEITAREISELASVYSQDNSCVVKIVEPRACATVDSVGAVLERVAEARRAGEIGPWEEEDLPENIVNHEPEPGTVVEETSYEEMGCTQLVLSNGMRVCYKCTDFLDDQVLISGFAYGGLSEVPLSDYASCTMAQTIAGEVGVFGHKPAVLSDMLAGKRVEVGAKISSYMRTFSGESSPYDLETAFQLVYQLFSTRVRAEESDMRLILQMTREAIRAQERDPASAFVNRVRQLNYGDSPYFKAVSLSDLKKVDPVKACDYFATCFSDPSPFTVVIVGNMQRDAALPLILKYLGGIPRPAPPADGSSTTPQHFRTVFQRENLTALPFKFPDRIIREEVRRVMVEEQGTTQVTFPLEIPAGAGVVQDVAWVNFLCKLVETRVLRTLRFKHGHVYSVAVSPFLGGSRPSKDGGVRGDVALAFSCDPNSAWTLVDMALAEVSELQRSEPTADDVKTVIELEQRAYETGQQENGFWLERILRAYQSRLYDGDVYKSYLAQEEVRRNVIAELSPPTMTAAACRLLPSPCTKQYTAVSLVPLAPLWRRLLSLSPKQKPGLTRESMVALAVAGVAVSAAFLWRQMCANRGSISGSSR